MSPRIAGLSLLGVLFSLWMIVFTGCSGEEPTEGRLEKAATSIPALAWIAGGLTPPDVGVSVLTPAGASPHGHSPSPIQIADLVSADLVLLVGSGFEPRAERALEGRPRTGRVVIRFTDVLSPSDLRARPSTDEHDHEHHDHDHAHDHGHAAPFDLHLWLDPIFMKTFVEAVANAISERLDPEQRAALEQARSDLLAEIDAVDALYRERLAPFRGRRLVTHHAAFGRLADRYGLEIAAVIQPVSGVEPTPGAVTRAVESVRSSGAGAIFIEPQFSASAARRIADVTGVEVIEIDPLGDRDWPRLMRANLDALVAGLEAGQDEAASDDPEEAGDAGAADHDDEN